MAQLLLTARLQSLGLNGFDVRSAGIAAKKGDVINPKSAQMLLENGIDAEGFCATRLSEKLLVDAFAVVCMTERQREYLMDMRWSALKKAGKTEGEEVENNVYSFGELTGYDVLDPYGQDLNCYRYVYSLLDVGMPSLIEKLSLREHAWTAKKPAKKKTDGSAPKKRGRPKKSKEIIQ